MLLWMEKRLGDIAATHPPEIARFLQVNVTQFQTGTAIMLEGSGYQPTRYFYEMVRPTLDDIPEFPLPEGLAIRAVLPEHYPAIWKLGDETSQEEWGYKKPTEDDFQEWMTSPQFQPHLWQVAWEVATNQVVGQVLTFIHHDENKQFNHKRGYTEGIGVDRSWRRRGLARALISRSLRAQKAAGMTEQLWLRTVKAQVVLPACMKVVVSELSKGILFTASLCNDSHCPPKPPASYNTLYHSARLHHGR